MIFKEEAVVSWANKLREELGISAGDSKETMIRAIAEIHGIGFSMVEERYVMSNNENTLVDLLTGEYPMSACIFNPVWRLIARGAIPQSSSQEVKVDAYSASTGTIETLYDALFEKTAKITNKQDQTTTYRLNIKNAVAAVEKKYAFKYIDQTNEIYRKSQGDSSKLIRMTDDEALSIGSAFLGEAVCFWATVFGFTLDNYTFNTTDGLNVLVPEENRRNRGKFVQGAASYVASDINEFLKQLKQIVNEAYEVRELLKDYEYYYSSNNIQLEEDELNELSKLIKNNDRRFKQIVANLGTACDNLAHMWDMSSMWKFMKVLTTEIKPCITNLNENLDYNKKLIQFNRFKEKYRSLPEKISQMTDLGEVRRDYITEMYGEFDSYSTEDYHLITKEFQEFLDEIDQCRTEIENAQASRSEELELLLRDKEKADLVTRFATLLQNVENYIANFEKHYDHIRSHRDAEDLQHDLTKRKDDIGNLRTEINSHSYDDMSGFDYATADSLVARIDTYHAELENYRLNPDLPEVVFDDDCIGLLPDGRLYEIDGVKMQFSLMNEDFNELLFSGEESSNNSFHDYTAYHEVVDCAVDVKKQPVFADYGDITTYPFFKPFSYQVDSVRTMLSRFEGRGIFGDQVGLGKTLQALMTADVMFNCGAIRNAVLVAEDNTIRQWRSEAEVKFRREDGTSRFELYPTKDDPEESYDLEGLLKKLDEDSYKNTVGNSLRFYLVRSSGLIKSANALKIIKDSNEATEYEIETAKDFKDSLDEVCALTYDLSQEKCISKMFRLADKLEKEFAAAVKRDSALQNERTSALYGKYTYEVYGKEGGTWSVNASEWGIEETSRRGIEGNEFSELEKYNSQFEKIRCRILEVNEQVKVYKEKNLYNKKRLIDLFIFDEVQSLLLENGTQKTAENSKEEAKRLVQEFIANIKKKYCILISATPIKNDLSDIFNLLYMVDKDRLGSDKKSELENRFYNSYCGGCRSLSEMANADNSKEKFRILNGLINSMFTRKRTTDSDVVASMRRHCSTEEELVYAEKHSTEDIVRDDYGGAKFIKLAEIIGMVHNSASYIKDNPELGMTEEDITYRDGDIDRKIDDYREELFPGNELSIFTLREHFKKICRAVDQSLEIERKRLAIEERLERKHTDINIANLFITYYNKLKEGEDKGKTPDQLKSTITTCNYLCSYINRGLLDFYRKRHEFSTVFLIDYIDWRRPIKRGVPIAINNGQEKVDLFADAFVPDDDEDAVAKLGKENVTILQQGKVLFFEKGSQLRADMFHAIMKANQTFGERRKIYIDIVDGDVKIGKNGEVKYTKEDLLYLNYFCKGKRKAESAETYKQIMAKPPEERTYDEQRFIETWSADGNFNTTNSELESDVKYIMARESFLNDEELPTPVGEEPSAEEAEKKSDGVSEKKHRGLNARSFSQFTIENGNWNAIYFMNKTQIAGSDLNAANVLVIGQLDESDNLINIYLDPLRMEQLIGRISRTGQTEECVVFVCLFNDRDDGKRNQPEFNREYYNLLSDREGFDLFGACKTEVDFVVPVVMACLKRLFAKEHIYSSVSGSAFKNDKSEFRAVAKGGSFTAAKNPSAITNFPEMFKFAFDNNNSIEVYYNDGTSNLQMLTPVEAVKKMVRVYTEVLGHDTVQEEEQ